MKRVLFTTLLILFFVSTVYLPLANSDSVNPLRRTDDISRSKAAFAVVNEAIARGLNLHTLSELDYWKLRGPVLLDPQTNIHFQLRERYDRIVNTVDFGAALAAGSPSQNSPISPENQPVLYQKAAEIIRDFIAQTDISVIIVSNAPIGIGETAAVRRLRGEVRYTYEIINSAAVSVPLKNIASLIKLPFITEIWPDIKGNLELANSIKQIGADKVHNALTDVPRGLGVTGKGVTVAVVDDGIYSDHPALVGRVIDTRGPWTYDGDENHGTHVAGIIGAAANGNGITGVAPEVYFLDAYTGYDPGDLKDAVFGEGGNYSEVIDAIQWAAQKKKIFNAKTKADIINLSVGWDPWAYGRTGADPMSKLIDNELPGIVIVKSAGNTKQRRVSGQFKNLPQTQQNAPVPQKQHEFTYNGDAGKKVEITLIWKNNNNVVNDLDLAILDSDRKKELKAARTRTWGGTTNYGTVFEQLAIKVNELATFFVQIEGYQGQGPQDYEVWLGISGEVTAPLGLSFNKPNPEKTVSVPGYSRNVITVGAINDSNDQWEYSAQGPSEHNISLIKPEVVAPGYRIESTVPEWTGTNKQQLYYKKESGTSMAAPHVSGVAALILDAVWKNDAGEWNFSPDEVKSAIVRGAKRGGSIPNRPNNTYGAGLVSADNIIFGGTVQPGKKLRFKITPALVGYLFNFSLLNFSLFNFSYLNAENNYPNTNLDYAVAISWGYNEEIFPGIPPPTPAIPPPQGTATPDLDLEFSDENGNSLKRSNFHPFAWGSNYIKVRHNTLKDLGAFFYLDVVHRDPDGGPIRFTGASTHPIAIASVIIPSKVGPINTTTTAPPQGPSRLNLPEDAKARLGKGDIHHIAYSPDGTLLAAAGSVGVWLYDTETYQAVGLLRGHTYGVSTLAFSRDGKTIATGNGLDSRVNTVRLWDVDTGTEKNTLTTGPVKSVAFSPDGKTIATADGRDPVRLWDVDTGTEKNTLTTGGVENVVFSPDGKTIATADGRDTVRLWSVTFGVEMKVFTGYKGNVYSIAFSPDGKTIAGGGSDNTARLWDVDTGETKHTLTGHTGAVRSVTFSLDGKTIATGSRDDTVRLWDVTTGETKHTLTGPTVQVSSIEYPEKDTVAFSPDGKTIASVDLDFTVRLWDVETGAEKKTLTRHTPEVYTVAFSPDGNTLASGERDSTDKNITVRLWDVDTGAEKKTLIGHEYSVHSVAFSPDGKTIATAGGDNTVRLWDVDTGAEKKTLTEHQYPVNSVAFSPDGKTIASGGSGDKYGSSGTVHLWDVETGESKHTLTQRWHAVTTVAFNPDGNTLATGGRSARDGSVRLWDVDTGENTHTIPGSTRVYSIAFSPDGKTIAIGGDGESAYLWNLAFDEIKHTLRGDTHRVHGVAFSPDGKTLATASGDNTVRLWDVKTGESKHTLTGHMHSVNSVAFSPDGNTLASGSQDGTVLLWDVTPHTVEPPEPEYPAWDVNQDGQVNILDLVSVSHYLGEPASAAPRADVNGDGNINIRDLLLVTKHIEKSTDAAAPARIAKLEGLDLTTVEGWLALARIEDDGSLMFQQGIAYLERLLAALTPKETALFANYPNPFNPETWFPYQLATPADVALKIYDIQGRVVRDLNLGHQRAGMYHGKSRAAYWDGRNAVGEPVASGVYFYTLKAGDFTATRKMLIRK